MNSVCVYCGSNLGAKPVYRQAAEALGRELAGRGLRVIYGGGNIGLMGALANAALAAGGEVVGVIPDDLLRKEVGHRGVTELHVVGSMHQRKQMMADLSDGFIALPGGLGTLEELFEALTWSQLSLHIKPCGLLNVDGFFDALLAYLDHARDERFIKPVHRALLLEESDPAALLERMLTYEFTHDDKWIEREVSQRSPDFFE